MDDVWLLFLDRDGARRERRSVNSDGASSSSLSLHPNPVVNPIPPLNNLPSLCLALRLSVSLSSRTCLACDILLPPIIAATEFLLLSVVKDVLVLNVLNDVFALRVDADVSEARDVAGEIAGLCEDGVAAGLGAEGG